MTGWTSDEVFNVRQRQCRVAGPTYRLVFTPANVSQLVCGQRCWVYESLMGMHF